MERRRDIGLIFAPSLRFGGAPAERGENPPISARGTRTWSFRRDGAKISPMSLRRSTPTPPGGVTQPVVGVAPAVLAPRRPPPGPAEDPPRGRPGGATSVSCTSFYHSFDHSLDTVAHSEAKVSLKQGAIGMPTNGAKASLPPPLSIITKNTFHRLPYVTCYE